VIADFPDSLSKLSLASLATPPPRLATVLLSSKPSGLMIFEI